MTKSANREEAKAAVARQMERLRTYCLYDGKELEDRIQNTTTTYFSQRDNYTQPHRTCNSSSNAMYLDWLRAVTGRERLNGDDGYLKRVLSHGDTIFHWAQTRAIKDIGFSTQWMTDHDTLFIDELEKAGFPVVVNILHRGSRSAPRGGHIIMIVGETKDDKNYIVHDPYGSLNDGYTVGSNGKHDRISKKEFYARWQSGYRTLAPV